jgi:peptidoglycan/xylan/chitin deacetylase (PgdA/CDA1 family)
METLRRAARVSPAFYRGNLSSGKQNVAITFDDAFVSVAENALPELAKHGFHSTIFVPAGLLGSRPAWSMESGSLDANEIVMSTVRIATLPSHLIALGSHSSAHFHLSQLCSGDAWNEIKGSRSKLQKLTARDIRFFAFPYGDYNAETLQLCRDAGYDCVFSTIPRPVDTNGSDFVRGRVKVEPFDGSLEFFLKYNGAYAWIWHFNILKAKLRSIVRSFGNGPKDDPFQSSGL